ncbi:ABC transporter ATP-binding protein [Clostridium sp. AN503]|uniref:ABC transporter ATP-binding protein n=1 Tax=Clostridium sp. AN503 TaxID=3160598 RepID=UPI0034587A9F
MSEVILEVKNLVKYFKTKKGDVHAVDGVSFSIERGKTLGIVGESGCGKSTTGRTILRLIEPTSGEIIFEGKNIENISRSEMKALRKDMQIIFQDPFSSLDPRMTVSELIAEPIRLNKILKNPAEIEKRVLELMETVGLAKRLYNTYPHELDGGRRQRIGIARALSVNPKFIVCDEPVSALDVSIQAQILNLLKELQQKMGFTYIFITHNLSVVNYFADDIAVMYLGSLVEKAPVEELFGNPLHPYTKALLSAIPVPELGIKKEEELIQGEITSPINLPDECRFYKRCSMACEECRKGIPPLREITPGHFVACGRIG